MSASMRWLAAGAVLLLVHAVRDVRLHGARGREAALRCRARPGTPAYEAGANWTGVLFATYNGLAVACRADHSLTFVRRFGMRMTHRINLWLGAAGLLSMLLIRDPDWLLVSMIGLGFAWASIISLPYAMLANNLPSRKMGVNIGIFNIFIVIPQLLAAGRAVDRCSMCSPMAILPLPSSSAPSAGSWPGSPVLRVREAALVRLTARGSAPPVRRPAPAPLRVDPVEVTRRFSMTSAAGLLR